MNNLVAERQLGQQRLENLETTTQLLSNKEKELEDMAKLCQAKEGQLAEIFMVYEVTAENLRAGRREQGEERLDGSEEKLEAMMQLCQAKDKELDDAAELRRTLETVLLQKIKQEESQQLAMEQVEEKFQRRMSESQRVLEEERAEGIQPAEEWWLRAVIVLLPGFLMSLVNWLTSRKPPSPTPTPGCHTVQETLPVEDENVVPAAIALDRDGHPMQVVMSFLMQGKEILKSQKQADAQQQMVAQQKTGKRRKQERPRWAKMASDQRGRGNDARRAGAEGMGRRDRGAPWHRGPRPREMEWAQHWRAEFNPYRTIKGGLLT
ncbi:hypothetical protein SKAU_G00188850 [Synaphobranchus kaupii]|uniref:Uncharacterized protein n=1 Tax=Synaphobranchus kaupii TaxID=118154 RepID=A0A9Q1FDA9_SYNKA|nr:hypothetical protein SKAU_G00188850 [Synaphobranchus kaupii]